MFAQSTRRAPRRLVALLVGAGILASSVITATSAQAADPNSGVPPQWGTKVGDLHVSPSQGAWSDWLTRVWTDTAFDISINEETKPYVALIVEKDNSSGTLTYFNTNQLYTGPQYGPYNFGSDPAATGGNIIMYNFEENLSNVPTLDPTDIGSVFSVSLKAHAGNEEKSDPYFRAYFEVTATGWKVIEPGAVAKTDTVTTLAGTALNTGAVTLTATVAPAAETGTVSFKDSAGTELASVVPVKGVATWTSDVLTPGTTSTYSANYSGSDLYNPSASNSVTVTTVAEPAAPQDTDIVVTIPASASGLKFTITTGDVSLSKATLEGTSFVATGTLGNVLVGDSRTNKTAWTLNGKASDFVNTTDATKTIAASNLGWAPSINGQSVDSGGTAGATVTAGVAGGLSSDKPLAQAAANPLRPVTTVRADITLKAPADSAAGTYKAKLTLTLI